MEVPNEVPNDKTNQPKTAEDYLGYDPKLFEVLEDAKGETAPTNKEPVDVQSRVNEILKEIKVDEKGKFIYPENISPELKAAVAATKSFRDTQSSYTKTQQELKALQAEAEALREQVAKYETPTAGLSQEEQKELSELKYTNPDEWFKRMKALETSAQEKVNEKFKEVREQAKAKTVEEQRVETLEKFNEAAEKKLTKEQLDLYTPPIWQEQVKSGEMSFEDFLNKAYEFIHAEKVIKKPETPEQGTNLNNQTGGSPDPQVEDGIDYSKITF